MPLKAGPVVAVVDGAGVVVVVVALPVGAVVLVVVEVEPAVVVVVDTVEVVEVVDVGVGAGAGGGLKRFFTEVPLSAPPKIAVRGLPEISSIAVMRSSARTKTMAAAAAMVRHEKPGATDRPGARCVGGGVGAACSRCVAGASAVNGLGTRSVSAAPVASASGAVDVISTVSASLAPCGTDCPTTSVGAEDASTEEAESPLGPVPPSRRSKDELWGARIATCLTAWCPRSIDCATKAVAMVAAAEPMATPTIVPLTPKMDAMTAAATAPAVEARIWRIENFTPGVSSRPREGRRHAR